MEAGLDGPLWACRGFATNSRPGKVDREATSWMEHNSRSIKLSNALAVW